MTDTEKLEAIKEYMKVISKDIDSHRKHQLNEGNTPTHKARNKGAADKALGILMRLESIMES